MLPEPIKLGKNDSYEKPNGEQIFIRMYGKRDIDNLYLSKTS